MISKDKRKLFVLCYCLDHNSPQARALREEHVAAHLAYVESMIAHYAIGGPLFADDGQSIIGSTIIFKTESVEQARAWLAGDPYAQLDIWQSTSFHLMRGAVGDWVGGKAW